MNKLNRILLSGLVLGLVACGDDVTVTNPPPPATPGIASMTVNPSPVTLTLGGTTTVQMAASVVLQAGATGTPAITWASSAQTTVASVSGTGLVTAIAPGSAAITATATLGTSVAQAGATVNVVAAATCTIASIAVSPSPSVDVVHPSTLTLQAASTGSATCTASQLNTFDFSGGNSAVATINTTTGLITTVGAGTTSFTVKNRFDPSKSAVMSVNVTIPAPATVSIQSITQYATNVPVDLTNVAGQIEITLNVDPGAASSIKRAQALINGIVVAEQCFDTPANCGLPAASSSETPQAAQQILILSTNTRQVRKVGGKVVPVVFNGPAQITARIYTGAPVPATSNAVPVVLQNSDAILSTGWVIAPVSTSPSYTVPTTGPTWYKGDVRLSGGTYVSFFPVTPEVFFEATTCDDTGNMVTGTPQTGISLAGNFDCAGVEGEVGPDDYYVEEGVAPAADVIYHAADSDPEVVGTAYKVNGDDRYNLLSDSWPDLDGVFADNLGPTVAADVAFNVNYDQDWISATFAWSGAISGSDGGSGYNAASEKAYSWDGKVTSPVCSTSSLLLANTHGLAQTLTDKGADAYTVCGQAADNIGNTSRAASNKFGVDTEVPTAALALSRSIDPVGAYLAPSVSGTANTSKYGTLASVINQPWGLEAQDGRSGFNQLVITGNDAAYQTLTRVWPGATTDAGNSACTLSDRLVTTLSDGWKRTILPANPLDALDCGAGIGYYWYSGYVVDRAGNQSKLVGGSTSSPIARNFVYDLAAPNMTGIGYSSTAYTPGAAGSFGFSANDDLNIVEGQVGFNYTGLPTPAVGILFPYNTGAVVLGPGFGMMWPTLRSQLANVLNGTSASAPIIFRVDETCAFNGNPYVNCDVGTYGAGSRPTGVLGVSSPDIGLPVPATDAYNTNLSGGGQLTNAQKMPNAVYANVRDVLSRESLTGASGLFLATQFNPSTGIRSPWGYSNVATTTYGLDVANWTAAVVGSNVVATHKTVTSNGLTVFQSVHLFRLNTVTNALTHCGVIANPTAPTIDNGSYRTWTYTIALPTLANPCNAGNGVTGLWKVVGVYNGAALATPGI